MNKHPINLNNLVTRIMIKSNLSSNSIKLEVDMKVLRKMAFDMEEENFSTKTAGTMMVNGKRIKCMDGVNYTMKVVN
jgi:hypothetical protein